MNCYTTGKVNGYYDAGGLVWDARYSIIRNSVALNQWVNGRDWNGWVIGHYDKTTLNNNYAWAGMKKTGKWTGYNGESISYPWDNTNFFKNTLKFDENWIMGTHNDYRLPLLAWQPSDSAPGDVTYLK